MNHAHIRGLFTDTSFVRRGAAYTVATLRAAFFSQRQTAAHAHGVKRVAIPNRSTKSAPRKRLQKKRWFRNAQRWRTGCEGRISLLKRRHGLNRCRNKGLPGIERPVGIGVIADNLINIGHALAGTAERQLYASDPFIPARS